jgi:alkaline phosphatase
MVESGLIDQFSHVLDWERAVYDTIMLDNAVAVANRFAAQREDTLIIVVADHAHPVSIIGTYETRGRASACATSSASTTRQNSPTIPRPTATAIRRGLSRPLCHRKPFLGGPFKPTQAKDDKAVANESYCTPQATRMENNLPFTQRQGARGR